MPNIQATSTKKALMQAYDHTRYFLYALAIFTLINIVFVATGSDVYFLFTAMFPYIILSLAMFMCGLYPPEYYEGALTEGDFLPYEVFTVALVVAIVIALIYALAGLLSRKGRVGWLVFALVIYSIDTFILFCYFGFGIEILSDYLFHALVIFVLARGIHICKRAKELPDEPEVAYPNGETFEDDFGSNPDAPIRTADMNVKCRVFLVADVNGKNIIYRRVGKVNELVVNSYVYAEFVDGLDLPHTLRANVDGHIIEAGITPSSPRMFINVDGQTFAKKVRWF